MKAPPTTKKVGRRRWSEAARGCEPHLIEAVPHSRFPNTYVLFFVAGSNPTRFQPARRRCLHGSRRRFPEGNFSIGEAPHSNMLRLKTWGYFGLYLFPGYVCYLVFGILLIPYFQGILQCSKVMGPKGELQNHLVQIQL
ncbi:hypothetical protein LXL04_006329 [Taraxacum kok-saghyz]